MKYLFISLLLLWLVPITVGQPQPPALTRTIQQVETGLRSAVELAGQPIATYSIADRMKHYKIPAVSIAVVNNGQIEWAKAYGFLRADGTQKVDTQTLFQAASISKPISALGALRLVEQGKLDLDTDVNKYLTSWKVKPSRFTSEKPVTLRGLLTHTAGLTVHGFNGYGPGKAVPTLVQVLNGEKPANSPAVISDTVPGSRWQYSGGGYVIVQQLIEDITGQPFADYMQQTILTPIGMSTHSTFRQPLPAELQQNTSIAHANNGTRIPGDWHVYPEQAPAGLWTTPSDLARYIISVQQSLAGTATPVLSQSMTRQMLTKHLGNYGLGPGLGGKDSLMTFGHGGGNEGYRCFLYAFQQTGQGVVIMTNSDNGMDLINEMLRSVSQVYDWKVFKPTIKKLAVIPPEQLMKLAGRYVGQGDRKPVLEVTVKGRSLQVKQSWDGHTFTLLPEAERAFFLEDEGAPFTFDVAADGTINSLLAFGSDRWTRINE
ncbi:serine hydrolase domain-containing protein [Spirosoma utsteinense]|uniref:CubicO group peptidase (Beta-lactamase class C family) n=1 Tax=Spirosoma utsteinense TaxID=2585773 RepID=A0ABR6W5J1_9BACT|nr:serine hydrolase domain-containing protein [Spirosoma utsteinense]MBC3788564.1 CubicO group peptidase (beta-lactamase class C family) [Spirosoma utsteinense]MBC3791829.1 CubicO group peptidase (beta-lactamase class C family) [Spirosoma utsteinense]